MEVVLGMLHNAAPVPTHCIVQHAQYILAAPPSAGHWLLTSPNSGLDTSQLTSCASMSDSCFRIVPIGYIHVLHPALQTSPGAHCLCTQLS